MRIESLPHSPHQGRTEGEHLVAVAGRALGEQHHRIAVREAGGDLLIDLSRGMAALAVHEDRALEHGEETDDGPFLHFALGDEEERHQRADHGYVQPGHVV